MCLYNYNKKERKYKHLTYAEKTMIERWHNKEKLSTREIAKLLDKSERTIRRELKRGKTIIKDYLWRDVEVYSADVSNREYILNLEAKGKELKPFLNLVDSNKALFIGTYGSLEDKDREQNIEKIRDLYNLLNSISYRDVNFCSESTDGYYLSAIKVNSKEKGLRKVLTRY